MRAPAASLAYFLADPALPCIGRVGSSTMLLTRSVGVNNEADDTTLMAAVARGDAGAYRTLASRHLVPILRYATRLLGNPQDAEDATQDAFLRLWQHAADFETRGHKPSTWLYRVAHNLCVDRLRKRRDHVDESALTTPAQSHEAYAAKELAEQLERALAELPERQRAAIVLVHQEGLPSNEAAEVLECSAEALESLLARGRQRLRERLAGIRNEGEEKP